MKLKANDTLHISNVKADPIRPGEQFTINDGDGRQLVKRGLATEVAAKKKAAPKNKAAATSDNKAAPATDDKKNEDAAS